MIIRNIFRPQNATHQTLTLPELVAEMGFTNAAGQSVSPESAKRIATAYRCINVLSDDIAKMPLQMFVSRGTGQIERVRPDNRVENTPWLLEVSPNRWMTPFIFKKALAMWAITYGAGYAWQPARRPGQRRELFLLNSSTTEPVFDKNGNLFYHTVFSPGDEAYIPDVEVFALLINSMDGISGRSVITYARESLGRQMGAYETQGKFYAQGLNPGGLLWMNGELSKEARDKVRSSFEHQMAGTDNAYRLAILDQKAVKFEQITMKPTDVQFLESIQATDVEIANFFGVPLYKLNQGKQSYNSNEQQNLDYLTTTLDPYLVQWEQTAALKWLSETEQNYTYFRFNRDVLLRTDAKTRADTLSARIQSGQLSPNEARAIEDQPAYPGGDGFYMPANMARIGGENA